MLFGAWLSKHFHGLVDKHWLRPSVLVLSSLAGTLAILRGVLCPTWLVPSRPTARPAPTVGRAAGGRGCSVEADGLVVGLGHAVGAVEEIDLPVAVDDAGLDPMETPIDDAPREIVARHTGRQYPLGAVIHPFARHR